MNKLIDAAIEWANNDVPVFPCGKDKRPLTEHGFYDAVTEPNEVKKLFEKFGDSAQMIGGRMGNGLFAVDIDLYKGDAPAEWFKSHVEDGSLPETRTHETKSKGLHFLYEGQAGCAVPAEGVEIKGEGGYIILPGTPGYTVKRDGIVAAPASLMEEINASLNASRGSSDAQLQNNILSGRDFHDSLARIAARMADKGHDQLEIQAHLIRLLESSAAQDPGNKRHARWRKIMADDGGELSRIAFSAYTKYNPQAIHDEMGELAAAGLEEKHQIAQELFKMPQNFEPEQILFPPDEDPFKDEGYDAHEHLDVLNAEFGLYPLFAMDEAVLVTADPKTGKTAIMLTLALNIACGRDYGQFKVPSAGPVVYFGLEGRAAIRKRIEAWKLKQEEVPDTIPLKVVEKSTRFFEERDQEIAAAKIVAYEKYMGQPVKLIVIDTLTRAMLGGDQNSADDTAKLFNIVSLIRDMGVRATVVFVHHNAKTGGARGSSNIEAEVDMILGVSKAKDIVRMKVMRARSVEDGAQYSFMLSGVNLGINKQGFATEGVYVEPLQTDHEQDVMDDTAEAMRLNSIRETIVQQGDCTAEEAVDALFIAGYLEGKTVAGKKVAPSVKLAPQQKLLHSIAGEQGQPFGNHFIRAIREGKLVTAFTVRKFT